MGDCFHQFGGRAGSLPGRTVSISAGRVPVIETRQGATRSHWPAGQSGRRPGLRGGTELMKRLGIIVAATFLAASLVSPVAAGTGNGAPSGAHFNLNLIGFSNGDNIKSTTGATGKVIFVPLSGNCKIDLTLGSFKVLDNNCTDGTNAAFQLPNPDPENDGITTYSVFIRALGKPQADGVNTYMKTCAWDPALGET